MDNLLKAKSQIIKNKAQSSENVLGGVTGNSVRRTSN